LELFVTETVALGVTHRTRGIMLTRNERCDKIRNFPVPKDVSEVRKFLGTIGITRKWVKNFAEIKRPLSRLIGKVDFSWGAAEQQKCAGSVEMHGWDSSKPVRLYSDASSYGAGCAITQKRFDVKKEREIEVPIAYDAFTFSKSQRNYGTYKKELCLGVEICWIPGNRNVVADALSRTIFPDENSEIPSLDEFGELVKDERNEPLWIWKDGKRGYEELLRKVAEPTKKKLMSFQINKIGKEAIEKIEKNLQSNINEIKGAKIGASDEKYLNSSWYGEIASYLKDGTFKAALVRKLKSYCFEEGNLHFVAAKKAVEMIEKTIDVLQRVLKKITHDPKQWPDNVERAALELNKRVIAHLMHSPSQIFFGFNPAGILEATYLSKKRKSLLSRPSWRGPFVVSGFGGEMGKSYILRQIEGTTIPRHYHGDSLKPFRLREGYLILKKEERIPVLQNIRLGNATFKLSKNYRTVP
ncbi:hypothetical protein EPUL_005521, partial [Erysiphe pulchra]